MVTTATAWKLGGPIVGALIMGAAAILWDGFREKVTEGKVDAAVVETIKANNDTAHVDINKKLDKLDSRQKRDGRVTRAIARKLKIELQPEPNEE